MSNPCRNKDYLCHNIRHIPGCRTVPGYAPVAGVVPEQFLPLWP